VVWEKSWAEKSHSIFVDERTVTTAGGSHAFSVKIFLGEAAPSTVQVELWADGGSAGAAVRQAMVLAPSPTPLAGSFTYQASVPSGRPATDYTARIVPVRAGLGVPLEINWIAWEK